jgi:tetratricopeptide (TPR) repeat protein
VTPRLRVWLVACVLALAAAGATVAATVLTRDAPETIERPTRPSGAPVLLLDLGVRTDPEARALRRASSLYGRKQRREAGRIFARYDSVEAAVGSALSVWPRGTVPRLRELAREEPDNALVRLHLGLGLIWAGRSDEGLAELRAARRVQPDSLSAVRAADFLHPRFPRGLPVFVPSFGGLPGLESLPPDRQLALLERSAQVGGARDKLLYGVAFQRLGRRLSAEREFAEAARLAPGDPEPQVAVAVARFRKDAPERAFSRLGPLSSRFPNSQSVRFHLGLLLLWLGELDDARAQLERTRALEPDSRLGREASRFLERLESVGTR